MAENNINAWCKICGKGYYVCNSCLAQKTIKPWRTITDSAEHFLIYIAIHGYTISNNKEKAKKELQNCNLSGLEDFKPEIKAVIQEIMAEPKKVRTTSKKEKESIEVDTDIETDNVDE